jgi:hypothetical protein
VAYQTSPVKSLPSYGIRHRREVASPLFSLSVHCDPNTLGDCVVDPVLIWNNCISPTVYDAASIADSSSRLRGDS